jgi:hypothetical protein
MNRIGLIVFGLVIGMIVAFAFNQQFGLEPQRLASGGGSTTEEIDGLRAHVDQQIAALDNRLAQLGGAVDDLRERLASVGVQPAETETIDRSDPRLWRGNPTDLIRARQSAIQQDDSDRILAAGFTQDRIDLLDRRVEELQMEARQAQAEGGRTGESIEFDPLMPIPVQMMMSMIEPHSLLRPEIGDEEYERYLQAKGRRTTVEISQVLASSPAEQGGLRVGDEIVAYGGERVFSLLELRSLTANRSPGEPILVEIRRDGQSMQLPVSGGDMGIDGCLLNCRAN